LNIGKCRHERQEFQRRDLETKREIEGLGFRRNRVDKNAAHEKLFGPDHPWTKNSARVTADVLSRTGETEALRVRYGLEGKAPPSG
jgi:hypothetical protein